VNGQRLKLDDRQTSRRSPLAASSAPRTSRGPFSVQRQKGKNVSNRRAFSLFELLIVIAVAVVLAGLLFPVLANLRENAYRVVCASNQRQVGMAIMMYERDFNMLPYASQIGGNNPEPRNLGLANVGGTNLESWDGVGRLFAAGYCRAPNCFYCPSYKGENRLERHLEEWYFPHGDPIYTNFHYCGHADWITRQPRDLARSIQADKRLVLLTDSLRSLTSLNHADGMNMLMGDGSVRWRNTLDDIQDFLPLRDAQTLTHSEQHDYRSIWNIIEDGGVAGN
jgi:prepilin-type N-terminal cleavage/methylation domain-containing protein/prepilin-type processing-associated H-X9-DG protein